MIKLPFQDVRFFHLDDSSNVIALGYRDPVHISYDEGKNWEEIKDLKEIFDIQTHPNDKNTVFAISSQNKQYFSKDQGRTWKDFVIPGFNEIDSLNMHFHPTDQNLLMFEIMTCSGRYGGCNLTFYYSKDGLKLAPKKMVDGATKCAFAQSASGALVDSNRIYCSVESTNAFGHAVNLRLVYSDNFFKSQEVVDHPELKSGKIIDVRVVASFILVVVQSDRFSEESEVRVFVSTDGANFDLSDLDFFVSYGSMFFLDSSPLSLFLSLLTHADGSYWGKSAIYSLDSSGLHLTKLIDNVLSGSTTKLNFVDGVWMTNIIDDSLPDATEDSGGFGMWMPSKISSRISIDDGKTWSKLEIVDDDSCKLSEGCSLHLVQFANFFDSNKITTGPAPNMIFAFGNAGDRLSTLDKGKSYLSRDGGQTWRAVLENPSVFAFADQGNIIAAVDFNVDPKKFRKSNSLRFSLDQGLSWLLVGFPSPLVPYDFASSPDGSGKSFILSGDRSSFFLDFSNAYDRTCDPKKDVETIFARVSPDFPDGLCMYGSREKFERRKPQSQCFMAKKFEDVRTLEEECDCTEADYECAPEFYLSDKGTCVPDPKVIGRICGVKLRTLKLKKKRKMRDNVCKGDDTKFIEEIEVQCKDNKDLVDQPRIGVKTTDLEAPLAQYSYVATDTNLTNNILIRTTDGVVHASNNGGVSFVKVATHAKIENFVVGGAPGSAILLTNDETFYYTDNGGNSFLRLKAPEELASADGIVSLSFNAKESGEFIWIGGRDCSKSNLKACIAYATQNGGLKFQKLASGVTTCNYVLNSLSLPGLTIFCLDGGTGSILSSQSSYRLADALLKDVIGWALKPGFLIAAAQDSTGQALEVKVTVDGKTFADAKFPKDYQVEPHTAYAVLESSGHSVFMSIATSREQGHEEGVIIKSNSNGTSYVLSLEHVNMNSAGYVDYDRVETIEGVIIANVVANLGSSDAKKVKTKMSFDDGSRWAYIAPPAKDSNGKKYECLGGTVEKCSLNLFGFTQRPDYRDTFSSSSAVGYLIGVGTVGESLGPYDEASTFLSKDGGRSWKELRKGPHHWEYGDQGTILALVKSSEPTEDFLYSTDDGETWKTLQFSETPLLILDLATVPTDTARKFIVFAKSKDSSTGTKVISVDFTRFFSRQCELDLEDPTGNDFAYWTPTHPSSKDNCLFGHEAKFLRRAAGHTDCFIGAAPLKDGYKEVRNCTCTRTDFECDYNYQMDADGTCKLAKGLEPENRKESECAKPGAFEYFESTGYRKIPLSTCQGGSDFASWDSKPCPGKESEFFKHHSPRSVGGLEMLFILVICVVLAVGIVLGLQNLFKRGQIRLEEDGSLDYFQDANYGKVGNSVLKGAVTIAAGAVAVAKTVLKIDAALLERFTSRVLGRRPGRRNYVRVPDEEDELFGAFEDGDAEEAEIDFEVDDDPDEFAGFEEHVTPADNGDLFGIDDDEESQNRPHDDASKSQTEENDLAE